MKLAFCLYKYFPYGGLQRDFLQIAKECQKRGHEIIIYTMSWQGDKPDGMKIVIVPRKGFTNHGRNTNYSKWMQQHLINHPVDRIIGFNKMPNLDIYYAADTCFAKKVFTEKSYLYRITNRCRHYLAFEKSVFTNPHTKFLVLTQTQIDDFTHYYHTPKQQFFMLPPGIAKNRQYNENSLLRRQQFRHKNGIEEHILVITQIGSDFKRKGVDRSLTAIANLPESLKHKVLYLVVGQDNPNKYLQLAKKLGIENRVRFYSGRDDIPDFLFSSDLLIHPARQEAAGIVLIEALAAGVPVIVTSVSGYAFHVQQANAGQLIKAPYEQNELNLALFEALANHRKRLQWHQNAINYGQTQDLYHLAEKAADIILESKND